MSSYEQRISKCQTFKDLIDCINDTEVANIYPDSKSRDVFLDKVNDLFAQHSEEIQQQNNKKKTAALLQVIISPELDEKENNPEYPPEDEEQEEQEEQEEGEEKGKDYDDDDEDYEDYDDNDDDDDEDEDDEESPHPTAGVFATRVTNFICSRLIVPDPSDPSAPLPARFLASMMKDGKLLDTFLTNIFCSAFLKPPTIVSCMTTFCRDVLQNGDVFDAENNNSAQEHEGEATELSSSSKEEFEESLLPLDVGAASLMMEKLKSLLTSANDDDRDNGLLLCTEVGDFLQSDFAAFAFVKSERNVELFVDIVEIGLMGRVIVPTKPDKKDNSQQQICTKSLFSHAQKSSIITLAGLASSTSKGCAAIIPNERFRRAIVSFAINSHWQTREAEIASAFANLLNNLSWNSQSFADLFLSPCPRYIRFQDRQRAVLSAGSKQPQHKEDSLFIDVLCDVLYEMFEIVTTQHPSPPNAEVVEWTFGFLSNAVMEPRLRKRILENEFLGIHNNYNNNENTNWGESPPMMARLFRTKLPELVTEAVALVNAETFFCLTISPHPDSTDQDKSLVENNEQRIVDLYENFHRPFGFVMSKDGTKFVDDDEKIKTMLERIKESLETENVEDDCDDASYWALQKLFSNRWFNKSFSYVFTSGGELRDEIWAKISVMTK